MVLGPIPGAPLVAGSTYNSTDPRLRLLTGTHDADSGWSSLGLMGQGSVPMLACPAVPWVGGHRYGLFLDLAGSIGGGKIALICKRQRPLRLDGRFLLACGRREVRLQTNPSGLESCKPCGGRDQCLVRLRTV